ncbi:MAG: methylmalonyl Co-A mutase-associated GTPase MeaB [Deltaproteobacteria bacterium]|nr:methylmalonyl Co-A mutase-associated GTPase MeaB [Deltaproteobacteria bacterium]
MKNQDFHPLVTPLLKGDRFALSRAITLVESTRADHREESLQILEQCLPHSGNSQRIGITGVPGVGKSSFIEAFGLYLVEQGHRLAVLAIDPSSSRSKGSILGDKTRMTELAHHPSAYIRPSPSAGSLGGVASKTRESILLCEAAGFDIIFVETVGVGQSETLVHSMVDFFLLLMLAGAGDELQGMKRGIMEMADAVLITKADGKNKTAAKQAQAQFKSALHLFAASESGWQTPVLTCSALEKTGLHEAWTMTQDFFQKTQAGGFFEKRRQEQAEQWFEESVLTLLQEDFLAEPKIQKEIKKLKPQVLQGKLTPFHAAHQLSQLYFKLKRK